MGQNQANTFGKWCKSGVQTFFLTIGRFFCFLKDQMNYDEKSSLVYEVRSQNCSFVYIGQTKRNRNPELRNINEK